MIESLDKSENRGNRSIIILKKLETTLNESTKYIRNELEFPEFRTLNNEELKLFYEESKTTLENTLSKDKLEKNILPLFETF